MLKTTLTYLVCIFLGIGCSSPEPTVLDLLSENVYPTLIKKGGSAQYSLDQGILTGTALLNTPNTFLCTPELYSNFILDFEVSIDPRLNSGVQIRSEVIQDENNEALKGYQVEIDPSERAWSGGIYEERDRGWIANLSANPDGKKAFKNGIWNKYHIEAIDSSIRVWVNGINTTNLLDNRYRQGTIGLQVHSIEDSSRIGTMVQWRNIHLQTTQLKPNRLTLAPATPEINLLTNHLSEKEKAEGWLLYDEEKKKICLSGKEHLDILKGERDFELALEYTLNKGGRAALTYGQNSEDQDLLIFAILDDYNAPKDNMSNTKAGSLYRKIEATNMSTEGRDKGLRSHDQWTQLQLKCRNGKVEHWLNNDLVVSYNLEDFREIKQSKRIYLTTETDSICIRSIKYRQP